jgi:hypothetical protein
MKNDDDDDDDDKPEFDNEEEEEEEEEEDFLSEHTVSMRRALQYCRTTFTLPSFVVLDESQRRLAVVDSVKKQRADAERAFWDKRPRPSIEIVDASSISPEKFQLKFQRRNIPCLIQGFDQTNFQRLTANWRKDDGSVNRDWFLHHLGSDQLVPLRVEKASCLDEDGRAEECETLTVTLGEWVHMLETNLGDCSNLYLKDFHLQLLLENNDSDQAPLYDTPFGDMLNHNIGDFRFLYWGPNQSKTARHSDVLHSFSWSFNVVGTKKWKFYSPFENNSSLEVIQKSGECIFVPSEWQHDVVNLEETVSVNHNWVTPANVDRTWECLKSEMSAIHKEMQSWDMEHCWDGYESMLRGCTGLDVTAFFLMVLLELLRLLHENKDYVYGDSISWGIFRLTDILKRLLEDDDINLLQRLEVTLCSKALSQQALDLARHALRVVFQANMYR